MVDLTIPKIMGIINVTPDSFYDGGRTTVLRDIVAQAEKMVNDGATFLDIGGYSSRPGATDISEIEEVKRVVPVIEVLAKEFPQIHLSIDTFRSEVAKKAVHAGAAMVNDISGGSLDTKMYATVATLGVPYVLLHMKGTPQNMGAQASYRDVLSEVLYYFSEKIAKARAAGINDIIADPGFGFAKTAAHNFELLRNLAHFKNLDVPYLVGISRKSTIYNTLGCSANEALNGTTVLNTVALERGASILRVHDVKEASECVTLLQAMNNTD